MVGVLEEEHFLGWRHVFPGYSLGAEIFQRGILGPVLTVSLIDCSC